MEFFGSRDKIAQGKMQMQDGMPDGSLLLVPSDPIVDPFLPSNLEVVRFGDGAELTVSELTEFKDHLTFSTNFLDGQVPCQSLENTMPQMPWLLPMSTKHLV